MINSDFLSFQRRLVVTLFECEEYLEKSKRYKTLQSLLELSFKTNFFIDEIQTSKYSIELLDIDKKYYTDILTKTNNIVTTHLNDYLVNHQTDESKELDDARLYLSENPTYDSFIGRYLKEMNEYIVDTLSLNLKDKYTKNIRVNQAD